jgi:hypothetical protein
MYIKVLTWLALAVLLSALLLWDAASTFQLQLNLIVFAGATAVIIRAFKVRKYAWMAGFGVVAFLFNPAMPVFPLGGSLGIAPIILSMTLFAISLATLRPPPLLSIPSITDRTPGSESL